MLLKTLEFKDCSADDPEFRKALDEHERELERTNLDIKNISKQCGEVIMASMALGKCQKQLAECLGNFSFHRIDQSQTEDERIICDSLKVFARILSDIEEARNKIMTSAVEQFVKPLEEFRRDQIGSIKTERKKFEKESRGFYQAEEKHLSLSGKTDDGTLREADAALQSQRRQFVQASLGYVKSIQEVHEREKFEFVETIEPKKGTSLKLWSFLYSWMQFYRLSFDITKEAEPYMKDLQLRVQRTRDNFDVFCAESDVLMRKIKPEENFGSVILPGNHQICGFVYVMEKKAFGKPWTKRYCTYDRRNKKLTMVPFSHLHGRITGAAETLTVKSCSRRAGDSIDKRFCFDLVTEERTGVITFQALSEQDRSRWLDIMDGKEPIYQLPGKVAKEAEYVSELNAEGFRFVQTCIAFIEKKGLDEQGLYRVAGVSSKTSRFIRAFFENDGLVPDQNDWDIRTVTSSLKTFLRSLPEPLMTFSLHKSFIDASKREKKLDRVNGVQLLVRKLPEANYRMLEMIVRHLSKVAGNSAKNLMTVANLGVCFGPTLLRPEEESVAALVDIKFCNIVVEILIDNCQQIFSATPAAALSSRTAATFLPAKTSAHTLSSDHLSVIHRPATESRPGNFPSLSSSARDLHRHHRLSAMLDTDPAAKRMGHYFASPAASNSHGVYYSTPLDSGFSSVDLENDGGDAEGRRPSSSSPAGRNLATRLLSAPQYPLTPQSRQTMAPTETAAVWLPTANLTKNLPAALQREEEGKNVANPVSNGPSSTAPSSLKNSQPPARPPLAPLVSSRISTFQLIPSSDYADIASPVPIPSTPTILPPIKPNQKSADKTVTKRADDKMGSASASVLRKWATDKKMPLRRVRTLYQCRADQHTELSFEPNEIIQNVQSSSEPGWLIGELRGRKGLIPENYVEDVPISS